MSVSTIVGTCRDYLPITPNLNNLVHRGNYETYMSGSATKEALRAGGSASGLDRRCIREYWYPNDVPRPVFICIV